MKKELETIGNFLVTELTTELAKKQKRASGSLIRSFKSEVKSKSYGYEIAVLAESYFRFVDEGVNGTQRNRGSRYSYKNKKPPVQALIEWVQIKSIASGDRAVRSAAFAIQNYIYKNGVKGINVLESVLKKASDEYIDKIEAVMFQQIDVKINSILNGNNNR